jgi:hypothetical protein
MSAKRPSRKPPAFDERGEAYCPDCGDHLPPAVDYPHHDGLGKVRSWICAACDWEYE